METEKVVFRYRNIFTSMDVSSSVEIIFFGVKAQFRATEIISFVRFCITV